MFGPDFDRDQAIKGRDEGIRRVAANNAEFLEAARRTARREMRICGTATADDVRKYCTIMPLHPNAWGAIFKHKDFRWTGQYRRSEIVQGHGNMQRVWEMNDEN